MSFPRLSLIILPAIVGLPLLTGACAGAPVAVAAASYGSDAASVAETGKTTSDHFASIVTKKDCALWRIFHSQDVCRDRDMTHDVYHVNYDEPFRQQTEGGTEYSPAPHSGADAPATSWTADAYKAGHGSPTTPPQRQQSASSVTAQSLPPPTQSTATTTVAQTDTPAPAPDKPKHKKKKPKPASTGSGGNAAATSTASAAKPASQDQVASSH
jgi:hypothetical protein